MSALCAVLAVRPLVAQPQYDHWAAIQRTLTAMGGIDRVGGADVNQAFVLVQHLLDRGQFYLDLYEYQRVITIDHARQRDSIGRAGGVAIAAAPFFAGRALQELGRTREAGDAYRRVAAAAPDSIRAAARAWAATLDGGGRSWQQDVVNWRAGRPVPNTSCPAGDQVCALFNAVLTDNASAIIQYQSALTQRPQADYTFRSSSATGGDNVKFYDPLRYYVLAASDFALAARAIERNSELTSKAQYARGIALLRAGRVVAAENALRAATRTAGRAGAMASVYLGEALRRQGKQADAERQWRAAGAQAELMVYDARSAFDTDPAAALGRYRADSTQGLQRVRDNADWVYLARALLRLGRAPEAMTVLEAVRPSSEGTDIGRVKPDILLLLSYSSYVSGKDGPNAVLFTHARDAAAALDRVPIMQSVLAQLQELTAPGLKQGVNRSS